MERVPIWRSFERGLRYLDIEVGGGGGCGDGKGGSSEINTDPNQKRKKRNTQYQPNTNTPFIPTPPSTLTASTPAISLSLFPSLDHQGQVVRGK